MSYVSPEQTGRCKSCHATTNTGIGCEWLCVECQKHFKMPPTFRQLEVENEQLKQRILRLEEQLAQLVSSGAK